MYGCLSSSDFKPSALKTPLEWIPAESTAVPPEAQGCSWHFSSVLRGEGVLYVCWEPTEHWGVG